MTNMASKYKKSNLSDRDIMALSGKIPPNVVKRLGLEYMGIDYGDIQKYWTENKKDLVYFNYKVFEHWRNQYFGVEARRELNKLLERASTESGLVDPGVYSFLGSSKCRYSLRN